jgi:hypothetical protein
MRMAYNLPPRTDAPSRGDDAPTTTDRDEAVLTPAVAWVEHNQTVAMLGAFALGVFLGVLMRR